MGKRTENVGREEKSGRFLTLPLYTGRALYVCGFCFTLSTKNKFWDFKCCHEEIILFWQFLKQWKEKYHMHLKCNLICE